MPCMRTRSLVLVLAAAMAWSLDCGADAEDVSDGPAPSGPRLPQPVPHVAVRFNPMALLVEHVSGDLEVWPIRYVSLVASPIFISTRAGTSIRESGYQSGYPSAVMTDISGTGVELGVRGYLWQRPSRFAVGPFVGVFGSHVPLSYGGWARDAFGADVGVTLARSVLNFSGGVGVERVYSQFESKCADFCLGVRELMHGGGVRPRLLASVGLGF